MQITLQALYSQETLLYKLYIDRRHYCTGVNEDFMDCPARGDGTTRGPNKRNISTFSADVSGQGCVCFGSLLGIAVRPPSSPDFLRRKDK